MSDTGIKEDELLELLREDSPYEKARQMQQERFDERNGKLVAGAEQPEVIVKEEPPVRKTKPVVRHLGKWVHEFINEKKAKGEWPPKKDK